MQHITKWGFGMAPLQPATEEKNLAAIKSVKNFVLGSGPITSNNILDDINHVKGIFNRVARQDQWDWFTVNMYLDYPPQHDIKSIASSLASLRTAIKRKDDNLGRNSLEQLKNNRFLTYCDNYLNFDINDDTASEYIYILSRREEKDILKIGMTTRNVQKRVNEINSATGVLYPLSARQVYKVKNSKLVEKDIHGVLSEFRIRGDREFFKIDYVEACRIIDEYLTQNHLYYYE